MINDADISENQLLHSYGEKVCMNLLKDHTTQQNIYWATDSYADYGEDFTFFAPITLDKITSYASKEGKVITKEQYNELVKKNPEEKDNYQEIIRPRAVKSKEEQTQRAKDKAEVFTPAWICNAQNNLIDEEWFGRKEGLFNSPDPENPQKWINNEEKIEFPEGKTWKDYVADTRLEITCGEAPYLCKTSIGLESTKNCSSPPSISMAIRLRSSSHRPAVFFLRSLNCLLDMRLGMLSLYSCNL